MTTEQLRHLKNIVEHYGVSHQLEKAKEECNELLEEIDIVIECNELFEEIDIAIYGEYKPETMIDEIADVEVMINQLKIIFDCFGEVEERIDYKINRQLERIKNEV